MFVEFPSFLTIFRPDFVNSSAFSTVWYRWCYSMITPPKELSPALACWHTRLTMPFGHPISNRKKMKYRRPYLNPPQGLCSKRRETRYCFNLLHERIEYLKFEWLYRWKQFCMFTWFSLARNALPFGWGWKPSLQFSKTTSWVPPLTDYLTTVGSPFRKKGLDFGFGVSNS